MLTYEEFENQQKVLFERKLKERCDDYKEIYERYLRTEFPEYKEEIKEELEGYVSSINSIVF